MRARAAALVLVAPVLLLALAILLLPLAAEAQQTGKVYRIGYLSTTTAGADKTWVSAFQQGLRDLGYVEGDNVVIEQRHAAGQLERLSELAVELARLRVDVFVVYAGPPGIEAAKKASRTTPIVFTVSSDPVGLGLVDSLARPGGIVTGLSDFHADLGPKRLELIKDVLPSASRVAVLLNPDNPVAVLWLKQIQAAAAGVGVTLLSLEIKGSRRDDIDRAFGTIGKERPEAVLVIPSPEFHAHSRRIAELAVKHRLPGIGTGRHWAEAGVLMSYGANFADLWRRSAKYVDKILKGAKPADLPVEQPTKFELVINLKTAKALGLTIPPSLLLRADQVIE